MSAPSVYRGLLPAELFALDVPPLTYLVDGLCPAGRFGMLSGREKSGKGLIAIDLGGSVALEEPFVDRAVIGGRVGYFAAEEHLTDVRDRVRARIGNATETPFLVFPLNVVFGDQEEPDRLRLDDPDAVQRLADTIVHYRLTLTILDVLRELHDGPEDASDWMGPLLTPLRDITRALSREDFSPGILITHHHSYLGRSRGSTAIRAAVDYEWSFVRTDRPDSTELPMGYLTVDGRVPKRVVPMRFDGSARWLAMDAPTESSGPVRTHLLAALAGSGRWLTGAELADILLPPRAKKTVQNELARMVKEEEPPLAYRIRYGTDVREYHARPVPEERAE